MKTLLALVALFFTVPTFARIGETPAECIARYGEPLQVDQEKSQLIFRKGEIMLIAHFHEGKCDRLSMRKAEQDILGNPAEMSDTELQVLMEANGGGKVWRKKDVLALANVWETEDGAVSAQYETLERFFTIYTKEALARQIAEKKAADEKKLDGF